MDDELALRYKQVGSLLLDDVSFPDCEVMPRSGALAHLPDLDTTVNEVARASARDLAPNIARLYVARATDAIGAPQQQNRHVNTVRCAWQGCQARRWAGAVLGEPLSIFPVQRTACPGTTSGKS